MAVCPSFTQLSTLPTLVLIVFDCCLDFLYATRQKPHYFWLALVHTHPLSSCFFSLWSDRHTAGTVAMSFYFLDATRQKPLYFWPASGHLTFLWEWPLSIINAFSDSLSYTYTHKRPHAHTYKRAHRHTHRYVQTDKYIHRDKRSDSHNHTDTQAQALRHKDNAHKHIHVHTDTNKQINTCEYTQAQTQTHTKTHMDTYTHIHKKYTNIQTYRGRSSTEPEWSAVSTGTELCDERVMLDQSPYAEIAQQPLWRLCYFGIGSWRCAISVLCF